MYAVVVSEFPQWDVPRVRLFNSLETAREYVKKVEVMWKDDLMDGDDLEVNDDSVTIECADNCDPWYHYCQIVVVDEGRGD